MENQAGQTIRIEDFRNYLRKTRSECTRRGDVEGARIADRADLLLTEFLVDPDATGEVL
jgi:hypothetical protein